MFGHTPDQYSDFVNKSGYNGTDVNPLLFLFSTSMYVGDNLQTSSTADPNGLWHYNSTNSPLSSAVLMCNAIVMDVAFRYAVAENSYSIVSSTPSTNNATIRAVTAILNVLQSPVEDFISVLQPIALSVNTADDFLRAFEKNFAKVYLPFAYSAFEPIPANRVVVSETVQGSSIPTLWLLAYLALLIVLGLFALLHGLSALKVDKTSVWRPEVNGGATTWFGKRSLEQGEWVSIAQLAAERLSAPAALVFEAFERSNGDPDCKTRSLQLGGVEMFKESRKDGIPSSSVGIGVVGEAGSAEARRDAPFGLLCIPPPYESYPSQAILTSDADIGKDRRVLTKREWSTKDA
ncbi:hypothetical protein FRC17_002351 [Serendipita sp. 399]|nr:hypothetical protein FRC17_002351 [Serendipita sp. 399]